MQDKSFLFIFCGIPCSGKSTIASRLARGIEQSSGRPVLVVSTDLFRSMISSYRDGKFIPENEPVVRELARTALEIGLKQRYLTIIDDLNYYVSMRSNLASIAKNAQSGFCVIRIEAPLERALEWNKARGQPVPQSLIEDIWSRFEPPGLKHGWDKPITVRNTGEKPLEELGDELVGLAMEAMRRWERAPQVVQSSSTSMGEIERLTRRAMGEVITRMHQADLAPQLSILRRQVAQDALSSKMTLAETERTFTSRASELIQRYGFHRIEGKAVVHVGLFGHVDHGKTAIARCLTEHASTASLDKHPEAQRRGITIDLGFSSFELDKFVVNLVDMPGHHSLVKQVLSGASIIDAAILVIDAKDGPGVQTTEHLAIIRDLKLQSLLVVLNKADLVTQGRLAELESSLRVILEKSGIANWDITSASALKKEGIEDIRAKLSRVLKPHLRDWSGAFKMPIDHSFVISGVGTVVTGTILRGTTEVGSDLELMPARSKCRVKMIQMFGGNKTKAAAGDRVGVALLGVRTSDVKRGYVLCSPGSCKEKRFLTVQLNVDHNFPRPLNYLDMIHVNAGLTTVQATLIPFVIRDEKYVVLDQITPGSRSLAFLRLNDHVLVDEGDTVLLMKLDLPPKAMRVIGSGVVKEMPEAEPDFHKIKLRVGVLADELKERRWVVSGLFQSLEGARQSAGEDLEGDNGETVGRIVSAYGSDGAVEVEFQGSQHPGAKVHLATYRKMKK